MTHHLRRSTHDIDDSHDRLISTDEHRSQRRESSAKAASKAAF
jgi:hypothetical protein